MIKSCLCYECRLDTRNATPLVWYHQGRGIWTNRVNAKTVVFTYSGHRPYCSDNRRNADDCPQRAPFSEYCKHCPRESSDSNCSCDNRGTGHYAAGHDPDCNEFAG